MSNIDWDLDSQSKILRKQNVDEESLTENVMARQIVAEIMKFGVNERLLCRIITLLSLELENRDLSLKISECMKITDSVKENKQHKLLIDV